jgi:hypothetical protein
MIINTELSDEVPRASIASLYPHQKHYLDRNEDNPTELSPNPEKVES